MYRSNRKSNAWKVKPRINPSVITSSTAFVHFSPKGDIVFAFTLCMRHRQRPLRRDGRGVACLHGQCWDLGLAETGGAVNLLPQLSDLCLQKFVDTAAFLDFFEETRSLCKELGFVANGVHVAGSAFVLGKSEVVHWKFLERRLVCDYAMPHFSLHQKGQVSP